MDNTGDSLIIDSAATVTGTFDCGFQSIEDLSGIGYFINIENLKCIANQLKNLPALSGLRDLKILDCSSNHLTTLPDLSADTALAILDCSNNLLVSLPDLSSNIHLVYFDCMSNNLDFSDAREVRIADAIIPPDSMCRFGFQNPFGNKQARFVEPGDTLTISIVPQDSAKSYQWYLNYNIIPGATGPSLLINNAKISDLGSYTCKSYGTALSRPSMIHYYGTTEFESKPIAVAFRKNKNVYIPDLNFRDFLHNNYPQVLNASGDSISVDSAATITGYFMCWQANISDLSGLEYFSNIQSLYCSYNNLVSLPDLSLMKTLKYFDCEGNHLTSLPDLSNSTNLDRIFCNDNQLSQLPDLSKNINLWILYCENNLLTSLPDLSLNPTLWEVDCSNNLINHLPDYTGFGTLPSFICKNNKLDFSDARELRIIDALFSGNFALEYSPQKPFGSPDSILIELGDSLKLSIAPQDSALTYQWFHNGTSIDDETKATYSKSNPTLDDTGIYVCKSYGTALMSPSMLHNPGISQFESEPIVVYTDCINCFSATPNQIRIDVTVFPNPTTRFLQIQADQYAGLELFDCMGAMMLKSRDHTIDFSNFEEGVYFVKIMDDKGNYSLKKVIYKKN